MNESVIELKQSVLPDADERGMRAFQTIWFGQLVYFVVSNVTLRDTIFGFNLSFAALAAGISGRFAKQVWRCVAVVVVAWAAMSVRTYWAVGQSDAGLVFTLVGLGGIVLVAVAGWLLRRRDYDRPWMMLGALSMIVGLVTMTMWPPP